MALLQGGNAEEVQPSPVALMKGTRVEYWRTQVHRRD